MNIESTSTDDLVFIDEQAVDPSAEKSKPWKILVVDDEEEVHRVTHLALANMTIHGRPLEIVDAYSGRQSVELMRNDQDIAIILMDVVMENDHAGLDAVQAIRNELGNKFVRIILRTGQPGQAPEQVVITKFDINDYKEKTELTVKKLYTVIHTSLSHYRELVAMHKNRQGLRKVIDSTATIFEERSQERFAQGVLEQLAALVYAAPHAMLVRASGIAATRGTGEPAHIVAGTGRYIDARGSLSHAVVEPAVMEAIQRALTERTSTYGKNSFVGYFDTRTGTQNVLYLTSDGPMADADRDMVDLFCRNVGIGLENLHLWAEADKTQREMILTLCDTVESRSRESGHHVRRVAEFSRLLGLLCGLTPQECDVLFLASPLHDVGKVAIPDRILHKPGRLDADEWAIMQTHAQIGCELFARSPRPILRAASIVSGQHHERWDGHGYPRGLSGEGIHVFGRITALADVFDALDSRRCYKEKWNDQQIVETLTAERGRHFDPRLVDLLLNHMELFTEIRAQFPDPEGDAMVH